MLYSLHWLPVQFRIDFKILIITFKAIYGHAPGYIGNLIHIKDPCMSLWNELPSEIRDEDNFERFKSKLKTILFRAAYPVKST